MEGAYFSDINLLSAWFDCTSSLILPKLVEILRGYIVLMVLEAKLEEGL